MKDILIALIAYIIGYVAGSYDIGNKLYWRRKF